MSPFLSSSSFQWWPHLPPSNPSSSSSSLTPTNFPSSFTASINMLFALNCLPFQTLTYSLSLRVCANYSVWPPLVSCPKYLTRSVPPDVLIPAPVRPALSPKRSSVFELLLPPALLPVFSSVHRCSHNCFSTPLLSFLLSLFGHICHISPPVCCFVCQVWASCRWFSQMVRQLEQL